MVRFTIFILTVTMLLSTIGCSSGSKKTENATPSQKAAVEKTQEQATPDAEQPATEPVTDEEKPKAEESATEGTKEEASEAGETEEKKE